MKPKFPSLQFAPGKEAAYRRSILQRIVLVSRIGLGVGAVAIPAFIANDLLFNPAAPAQLLAVRLALALLNAGAMGLLFLPAVRQSPAVVRLMFMLLFPLYSLGLVLIQTGYEGGVLINVPGYVQVMVFVPILCFSFVQAVGILLSIILVAVIGTTIAGAPEVALANLTNWLLGSTAFALGAALVVDRMSRRSFDLELDLNAEKARSDELLLNILPERIAERLKNKEPRIADQCPNVTVLFADIEGFTNLSRDLEAGTVVDLLNDLFSRFDDLAARHRVEKIKTIGDGYMAVAGLSKSRDAAEAAQAVADLALDMQAAFARFREARTVDLRLRIGLHSGPVIAGVIGTRKFAFDLWGDTVNVASRIETSCPGDRIQISRETRDLLGDGYRVQSCGEVEIRGHDPRETFLLLDR